MILSYLCFALGWMAVAILIIGGASVITTGTGGDDTPWWLIAVAALFSAPKYLNLL